MTDTTLSHDDARVLFAAYALGALGANEIDALESALKAWPEGRRELAEFMGTADSLMVVPTHEATPPLGLEGRIIAKAREQRSTDQSHRRAQRRLPFWRRRLPHAFAAGFAIVAAVFGVLNFTAEDPVTQGRWLPLDGLDDGLVYVTDYRLVPVSLLFLHLDPPPDGSTYQLWLLRDDLVIVPGQAFSSDAEGNAMLRLAPTAADAAGAEIVRFAVSVEPEDAPPATDLQENEIVFSFPAR